MRVIERVNSPKNFISDTITPTAWRGMSYMASNRFKIIYSNSDETKSTQYSRLEELKEKGVQAVPQEEPTITTPKFCPHCGKEGEIYSGLIPVRGLKPYTWLLCTLFIVAVWVYVWWYAQNEGALSSWLINIGLVISPIALSLCALIVMKKLASPHLGQAVICHDCNAAYPLSEAPRFTQGWDMNKFMLALHGQDKKSRRRKAMMEKLVKKAGMSASEARSAVQKASAVSAPASATVSTGTTSSAAAASALDSVPISATAAAATEEPSAPVAQQPARELTPEEVGIAAARADRTPNKNSLLGRIF